jgi:S-adenosylmethionine:tRNA ribosyltransferase-isomerase
VFNDSKVIPARLFGSLDTPHGAEVELLLLERISDARWMCIGRPLKKVRAIGRVRFGVDLLASVVPELSSPERITVDFETSDPAGVAAAIISHGTMPIPPYIRGGRGDAQDTIDYQSIFAENPGSVAAPTASLHFTPDLMGRLTRDIGVAVSQLTLHVGSASFLPILDNGVLRRPGSERLSDDPHNLSTLAGTRSQGGRVVAIGTTVVRALESAARNSAAKYTDLFISPGFEYKALDALVTNLHQPGTTHLLLVEALLGRELLKTAYEHALGHGYRFLSYGDGMLII